MKMYIKIFSKIIASNIFIGIIFFTSCQSPIEPIESDNPSIYFESKGFFAFPQKLSIDKYGLATYEITYPTLQLQLSEEELNELKFYLKNLDNYQDSYPSNVLDDTYYTITLTTDTRTRSVEYSNYSIRNNPELGNLEKLTDSLLELCKRIYNEKSTWEGLTYQFILNDSVYSQNDTIKYTCRIINSTDKKRSVYFKNNYKIQLIIQSELNAEPHIYLFLPSNSDIDADTASPSKLDINSGEEIEIASIFNQEFYDSNHDINYKGLPIGTYTIIIRLLGAKNIYGVIPYSKQYIIDIH